MTELEKFFAHRIEQAEKRYMNDTLNLITETVHFLKPELYDPLLVRATDYLKDEIQFLFSLAVDELKPSTMNKLFGAYQVRKWVPNLIDLYEGELEIEED